MGVLIRSRELSISRAEKQLKGDDDTLHARPRRKHGIWCVHVRQRVGILVVHGNPEGRLVTTGSRGRRRSPGSPLSR